jgi:hypothetical protein
MTLEQKLETHAAEDKAEVANVQTQIDQQKEEEAIAWTLTEAQFQALAQDQRETRALVAQLLDRLPETPAPSANPEPEANAATPSPAPALAISPAPASETPSAPARKGRKRSFTLKRRRT